MIFRGLTPHNRIIYVSLYIPSQLLLEHLSDHSLIGRPYVLQLEGHDFVMKITCKGDKRSFLLILRSQCYLMVPLESIKKTHARMFESCINKLVYLRYWKRIL